MRVVRVHLSGHVKVRWRFYRRVGVFEFNADFVCKYVYALNQKLNRLLGAQFYRVSNVSLNVLLGEHILLSCAFNQYRLFNARFLCF